MSNTINIDGREFSEETVKEALKKHCNFESDVKPKIVIVDKFRAAKDNTTTLLPYWIGCVRNSYYEWDGKSNVDSLKAQIYWYGKEEVEQIIAGLQGLLDS